MRVTRAEESDVFLGYLRSSDNSYIHTENMHILQITSSLLGIFPFIDGNVKIKLSQVVISMAGLIAISSDVIF